MPGIFKKSLRTPERLNVVLTYWPQCVDSHDILAKVKELPGPGPVTLHTIGQWAREYGVRRSTEWVRATNRDRMTRHNEACRAAGLPIGRPVEGRAADDEAIIKGWREGATAAEIGKLIHRTKNSIIGRVHRLVEKGLLEKRPSALVRTYERAIPRPPAQLPERIAMPAALPAPRVVVIPVKVNVTSRAAKPKPPGALPVAPYTKGHREMPFRVGAIGDYIYRIKKPAPGRCTWPLGRCDNPTEGGICDVHQALIRKAA